MNIVLHARVEFILPLTSLDVETLVLLSHAHYDAKCRAASQPGGFLFGWTNAADFWGEFGTPPDERTVNATWSDLDTCLKIMEWPTASLFRDDPARQAAITTMNRDFRGAMRLANEKAVEWTATYEGKTT